MVRRDELFARRAASFYAMKDYDKAIVDYSEALKIRPSSYSATVALAGCYFWKGDFPKAIELYTQAIALIPNNAKNAYAYSWRGSARSFPPAPLESPRAGSPRGPTSRRCSARVSARSSWASRS